MWTSAFWKDAVERAVKTFAQVTIPTVAAAVTAGSLGAVDWTSAAIIIGGSVALSLLTSMGSTFRGSSDSASLLKGVGK
jgi:hypothetical protein